MNTRANSSAAKPSKRLQQLRTVQLTGAQPLPMGQMQPVAPHHLAPGSPHDAEMWWWDSSGTPPPPNPWAYGEPQAMHARSGAKSHHTVKCRIHHEIH